MENWEKNDADFKAVYYEFYMKARRFVMNKSNNKEQYFQMLQSISPEDSLMDILNSLKEKMASHSYELSLGSKLLHTRYACSPIYDSKVRKYLSEAEDVNFWWQIANKESGAPRGTSESEKIEHDWKKLCEWYKMFLESSRGKQWIDWFDSNFPAFADISNVKKVDFIIYVKN